MEPDICVVIRKAMALSLDCNELYGWDFAETYRAVIDAASTETLRSASGWASFLDCLDADDLELPEDDE